MSDSDSMVVVTANELGPVLKDLERRFAGSTQAALTQIAQLMVGLVEDEFQTQGHGKWKPFAASTLRARLRKGKDPKLLQDTAIAAGSVTPIVEDDSAYAFTSVPYMIFHTSDKPRHIIPYRNPFDVEEGELLDQASDVVLAAVARGAAL